mmetsp:Transcript_6500/g.9809  ORF Transcript_6500/g.9809 Transcript_6500/m.9809 type:complete len:573 (-) Transcript_6500:36-1754(-)
MKGTFVCLFLVGVLSWFAVVEGEQYGGTKCAACTVLARMIQLAVFKPDEQPEQVALETQRKRFLDAITILCETVKDDEEVQKGCKLILHFLNDKERSEASSPLPHFGSPDQFCASLGICTGINECPLYPGSPSAPPRDTPPSELTPFFFSFGDYIMNLIHNISSAENAHTPVDDPDGDFFSHEYRTLRGRSWRGRDCGGHNDQIYPGRVPYDGDEYVDTNCNGIYGVDPDTNKTYEELWCSQSQKGLMILGDSIGAHFALPTKWYFIEHGIYDDFFWTLANEVCWPQMSTYTGFVDYDSSVTQGWGDCPDTWQNSTCDMRSIYLKMRERNLCMHRDFQNLAVSGADSSLAKGNVHAISRNQTRDQPVLFFYALIGDDICDHKSESGWTTPSEFRSNVLYTLDFLNTTLPPGSAVVLVGLVNGKVLWDVNHNREYPLGDITYADWFNWLNCLEISYCYGWLNDDPSVRDAATQRADELNDVLIEIVENVRYQNFEMAYSPYPFEAAASRWVKSGGAPWELIEPFDGLHASQVANALIADEFFSKLQREHPEWFGEENPFNEQIRQKFGDQGGY